MHNKLSNVCQFIIDCEHKTAPLVEDSAFISIRTPNIGKGFFILEGVNRVSEETFHKWTKRAVPQTNDLIMAREAPAGNVALIRGEKNICLGQRTVLIRPNLKKVNPIYLCYLLLSDVVQVQIEGKSTGATVAHLNMSDIRNLELPTLPVLDDQNKIAKILSAYDDLIEVNNQRIKTLEETASQLYKEWFVRMRFPGYKQTKLEKGIPKGWAVRPIGEIIDHNIGGGWGNENQTNEFSVGGYVVRGTDIPRIRKGQVNKGIYRFHKASNMKSRELREGDIIFETAGGSEGQLLGRTCFITQEILNAYGERVMAASFCKQLRTTGIRSLYLYYFLNYLYETGMIETFQVQSTGISNYQFEPFLKFQQIVLPKDGLIKLFYEKVLPIQKAIATLGQQNEHLHVIRDRLLPRLISGKLQIKTQTKTQQAPVPQT